MGVVLLLLVAGGCALLQSLLFHIAGLRGLTYRRSFSREGAYAGEQVMLTEVLENRSPMPLPWLRAESRMSPNLRLGKSGDGDERTVSGDMYHCSLFFMAGFSRITRRHPITLLRRGYYSASTVVLSAGDLFGGQAASRTEDTGAVIAVYPALMGEQEIPPMCRRFLGDLLVRRFIEPDPFLISGIRPYRPGDAPRCVNWRATARMSELQVNTFDYTADPSLLVVLNVQKTESQWGNLSDAELDAIERGVSLAATLCLQALRHGAEAGFAANTDTRAEENICVCLAPRRASAQSEALLMLFSKLTLRRALNFNTMLERLAPPPDADILILSLYESAAIHRAMAELRSRGHHVALQLLAEGEAYEATA